MVKQWQNENAIYMRGFRTRRTSRMEPFCKNSYWLSINHLVKQSPDQNTISRGGFRTVKYLGWSLFAKIVNGFNAKFQLINLLKYSLIYVFQLFSTWDSLVKVRSVHGFQVSNEFCHGFQVSNGFSCRYFLV